MTRRSCRAPSAKRKRSWRRWVRRGQGLRVGSQAGVAKVGRNRFGVVGNGEETGFADPRRLAEGLVPRSAACPFILEPDSHRRDIEDQLQGRPFVFEGFFAPGDGFEQAVETADQLADFVGLGDGQRQSGAAADSTCRPGFAWPLDGAKWRRNMRCTNHHAAIPAARLRASAASSMWRCMAVMGANNFGGRQNAHQEPAGGGNPFGRGEFFDTAGVGRHPVALVAGDEAIVQGVGAGHRHRPHGPGFVGCGDDQAVLGAMMR